MRISDWSSDVCSSDLLHRLRRRARRFLRQHVAEQRIEAQRVEAGREMVGDRRRNIERAAVGMVDAQPAAVQMQLVADRAGQEGGLAAIFEIGRASSRGRGCQYVLVSGVAVLLTKKYKINIT